jgi:signal transduction histidine kinase
VIDGRVAGAVRLTRRSDDIRASVNGTVIGIVVIGAAGLLAGIVIAFGLAGSLARPIQRLAEAAVRFGRGDLRTRVGDSVRGPREIEDLAGSFDEMADRVERTVRAQREFVANASHQLRTPLTGMKLQLENAIGEENDPDLRARLEAAEREVDRLAEIVERLLAAARQVEEGAVTHVDLSDAASRAVERWRERAERAGAQVKARGLPADAVANPADVDQVLDNLIDNAMRHAGAKQIELEARLRENAVEFVVSDRGRGIPEDELKRVQQPFVRGGDSSRGSGLGLAIVRRIAAAHRGWFKLESRVDAGTTATLAIPVTAA